MIIDPLTRESLHCCIVSTIHDLTIYEPHGPHPRKN
jgi:hypothetical protein